MSEFCKPKVIVVDDEHLIADTLTTILSRAGYDVRAVYSGDEAVEMALNFQPDLMLSDVVMPGITGIEALFRYAQNCHLARFCSSPGRRRRLICSQRLVHKTMNSRYSISPFIPARVVYAARLRRMF